MTRPVKQMPSFQAVAAGQTAVANLPVGGLSYHKLLLDYLSGATEGTEALYTSDIDEIRVILDGEVIHRYSGAELLAINKFYGYTHTAGTLPIYFSRPWQRTITGEEELKIGTQNVQTFHVEVDIAAGATSPSLALRAEHGPSAPLGRFPTVRKFAHSFSVTGENEVADFVPRGPRALVAVHISGGSVTEVEVEADQRVIYDAKVKHATAIALERQRSWQAGYFHVDFVSSNQLGDILPLNLQDLRARLQVGATGAVSFIAEQIEGTAPQRG